MVYIEMSSLIYLKYKKINFKMSSSVHLLNASRVNSKAEQFGTNLKVNGQKCTISISEISKATVRGP